MPKFKEGDIVRVVKGYNEGAEGTVTDPYWQISASDWPFVIFVDAEGHQCRADEDDMVLIEDPTFAYAIQRTIVGGPGKPTIVGDHWSPRDEVNMGLLNLTTERHSYKLVKRKKAGPIEDA